MDDVIRTETASLAFIHTRNGKIEFVNVVSHPAVEPETRTPETKPPETKTLAKLKPHAPPPRERRKRESFSYDFKNQLESPRAIVAKRVSTAQWVKSDNEEDRGSLEEVFRAIEASCNLNKPDIASNGKDYTLLIWAARNGQVDAVKQLLLLSCEVSVNFRSASLGHTALWQAAKHNHIPCMRLLLEHHADPNITSLNGTSALLEAADEGRLNCVRLLLEHKANPDAGNTTSAPVHWATANGHVDCVRLLLESGANPDAVNRSGYTSLYFAADQGNLHILRLLLEHGAEPNRLNGITTALLRTKFQGHHECAKLLVEYGADATIARTKQKTVAKAKGSLVAAYVQGSGAKTKADIMSSWKKAVIQTQETLAALKNANAGESPAASVHETS